MIRCARIRTKQTRSLFVSVIIVHCKSESVEITVILNDSPSSSSSILCVSINALATSRITHDWLPDIVFGRYFNVIFNGYLTIMFSGYQCYKCGRFYTWLKSLKKHVRTECGLPPSQQCPYCPHKSKQKWNMMLHIKNKHWSFVNKTSDFF